jgi:hypothetical protein
MSGSVFLERAKPPTFGYLCAVFVLEPARVTWGGPPPQTTVGVRTESNQWEKHSTFLGNSLRQLN